LKIKVCILDYGSGNVKSIYNMISYLGEDVIISNDILEIKSATHIILPGVGAFGPAMGKIKDKIPLSDLEKTVFNGKPFLGICIGMHALVEKSFEHGEYDGLGWIPGTVELLEVKNQPLPHIGWNNVTFKKKSDLFNDFEDINDFYFVHSYVVKTEQQYILTETKYETHFVSSIRKDNIYGVQFHPEKSQKAGMLFLKNFLKFI